MVIFIYKLYIKLNQVIIIEAEIYCLRCKNKVVTDAELTSMKTTRGIKYMLKGICPFCMTKLSKMTKNPNKGEKKNNF